MRILTVQNKELALRGLRASVRGAKIGLYYALCFIRTALRSALRGLEWIILQSGEHQPAVIQQTKVEVHKDVSTGQGDTESIIDEPCTESCIILKDGNADTPQHNRVPDCFEGTSDLSRTLPFSVSNLTKEIRSENANITSDAA